jgi:hypothetical protein
MQSKSLLIAIAAFAVTTTGASAYGGKILDKANLTSDQKSAIVEARELRQSGDVDSARNLLLEAGIDEEVLRSIHHAKREVNKEVHSALENNNYPAFIEAIADGPLANIITNEADFEKFQEAHELKKNGEKEEAGEIFDDLGVERGHKTHFGKGKMMSQLSDDQKEAVFVARQSNDREAIQAIFEEAGVERPLHSVR